MQRFFQTIILGSVLATNLVYAGEAVLLLTTEPRDASVYVDGELRVNITPVVIKLPAGPHRVRIDRSGYKAEDLDLVLTEGVVAAPKITLTHLESCLAIKNADPNAKSGVYVIDPDGPDAITAFRAYCDMTTDGGGYTLIQSYLISAYPVESTNINLGSGTYLPMATVKTLARLSNKVRISERDTTNYVESIDSWPISRLRIGMSADDPNNRNSAHFIGNKTEHLTYSCGDGDPYPWIYHAGCNGVGLHIFYNPHDLSDSYPSGHIHGWSNNTLNMDVWLK